MKGQQYPGQWQLQSLGLPLPGWLRALSQTKLCAVTRAVQQPSAGPVWGVLLVTLAKVMICSDLAPSDIHLYLGGDLGF